VFRKKLIILYTQVLLKKWFNRILQYRKIYTDARLIKVIKKIGFGIKLFFTHIHFLGLYLTAFHIVVMIFEVYEKKILNALEKNKIMHYLEIANMLGCSPTRAIQLSKQLAFSNPKKLEYRNGYLKLKEDLDEKTLSSINIERLREEIRREFEQQIINLKQKLKSLEEENNRLRQNLKVEVTRYINKNIKPLLCESCKETVVKILFDTEIKEE